MSGFTIFALTVVILGLVTVFAGVKVVPQGYMWTVERFGRYTRTLQPGLNLLIPYFDRVGHKISMMETVLDIPEQEIITKDNAMATVDGVVFYQVMDPRKAAYEIFGLDNAIVNLTMTNMRTVMGGMTLDDLLGEREKINAALLEVIDQATEPWGVKIKRIEAKKIDPNRDLVEAMASQMKAEREKRAAILQAEGQKEAEIREAEGRKQAQILEAEGKLEAARREAEAKERLAEAEAAATKVVSEAIKNGDKTAINYFLGQRYVDAVKEMAASPNAKVIYMPLEAANVIGSIGSIRQLFDETKAN